MAQVVDFLADAVVVILSVAALAVLPRLVGDARACRRALEWSARERESKAVAERAKARRGGKR